MANPYSKYTGARVQPLPAGFIEAYGRVGESYRKGIVGLAEGIQRYYQNKEERAIATGEVEALVAAASQNPELYPGLINEETQKKLEGMDNMSKSQLLRFNNFLKGQVSQLDKARKAEQEKALMQLQRDKLEAEKKKNLADAEAARLKAAGDAATQAQEKQSLDAWQRFHGVLPPENAEVLGTYVPSEGVSRLPGAPEPNLIPEWAAPSREIHDELPSAVESGRLTEEQAFGLSKVADVDTGEKMLESLEEDPAGDTSTSRMKELAEYERRVEQQENELGRKLNVKEDDAIRADLNLPTSTDRQAKINEAKKIAADATHAENRNKLHEITKRAAEAEATIKEADATPEAIAHRKGMRQLSMTAQVTQNMLAAQKVLTPEQILMRDTLAKHEMDLAKERLEAAEWANKPELRERAKERHEREVKLADLRIVQIQQDMNTKFAADPVRLQLLKQDLEKAKADRAAMETPEERQVRLRNEIADLNLKLQRSVLNAQEIAENENVLEAIDAGNVDVRDIPGAPGYKFVRASTKQGWQLINTDPQRGVRGVVRDVTKEEADRWNAELKRNGYKAMWIEWPAGEKGKTTYKFQAPSGAALDALLRSSMFGGDSDAPSTVTINNMEVVPGPLDPNLSEVEKGYSIGEKFIDEETGRRWIRVKDGKRPLSKE